MSYTTMLGLRTDETVELEEHRNAWGSAMRVWESIAEAHWPGGRFPLSFGAETDGFWKLHRNPRLARCERAALLWTFDRALCQAERAEELAGLLREFDSDRPAKPGYANHLPAVADALERHRAGEGLIAFAWIQTSVSSDVWMVQDRCPNAFHDAVNQGGLCPECGNERDDRRTWRRFVWGLDHEHEENYFIIDPDGGIGGLP